MIHLRLYWSTTHVCAAQTLAAIFSTARLTAFLMALLTQDSQSGTTFIPATVTLWLLMRCFCTMIFNVSISTDQSYWSVYQLVTTAQCSARLRTRVIREPPTDATWIRRTGESTRSLSYLLAALYSMTSIPAIFVTLLRRVPGVHQSAII